MTEPMDRDEIRFWYGPTEAGPSNYEQAFGRKPEAWREPLGALRLTLHDESAPPWQLQRARDEVEWLVRVMNGLGADVDWDRMDKEMARLLDKWRSTTNENYLGPSEESSFEYGFQLGYRVASGEVIP